MKPQEAIEQFKERLLITDFKEQIPEYYEAMETAIEALKKQMAKKVVYSNRHGQGRDLWNKDFFNCPACGRRLRNKQRDIYCGKCGQKLDWEHKESED